jgi:hypothetical protein
MNPKLEFLLAQLGPDLSMKILSKYVEHQRRQDQKRLEKAVVPPDVIRTLMDKWEPGRVTKFLAMLRKVNRLPPAERKQVCG